MDDASDAKERVRELLERMPDGATLEEVIDALHLLRAVDRGLEDVANGRVEPHELVVERLRRKWSPGSVG